MSSDGERTRMTHEIARARALLDALESHLDAHLHCSEAAQAVADATIRIVTAAGRHDAYQRSERAAAARKDPG